MNFHLGGNGNGKHFKMPKITVLPERKKPEPIQYNHVSDETINLHASRLLPKSEKLLFIDPKAVELPVKATPKLKVIVESMSKPVKKSNWSPQLLIGIAIMLVITVIGLTILYNSLIKPAAEADREFQLQWQEQCAANPETCALSPPPSNSGGGLFNFQPPNPFAPPPTRNK